MRLSVGYSSDNDNDNDNRVYQQPTPPFGMKRNRGPLLHRFRKE